MVLMGVASIMMLYESCCLGPGPHYNYYWDSPDYDAIMGQGAVGLGPSYDDETRSKRAQPPLYSYYRTGCSGLVHPSSSLQLPLTSS